MAAARRARTAGFDILYVYGSHTYLPTQFLSPVFNRRTDAYGGSFENRSRFWLEAIERVQGREIGDDCAIAVRIAADTLELSGVPTRGGARVHPRGRPDGRPLGRHDRVDGRHGAARRRPVAVLRAGLPARVVGPGPGGDRRSRWSSSAGSPTPTRWPRSIRGGHADLIGAARPSISDPFLPRKIEEGRYDEVRECIGCNACYSRSVWGLHLGCTQNATAGEEHRRGWHPERFDRAANADQGVLVVGAGPAGMECAMVLGKRGFELVHLVDAGDDIGGQMRWVTRLPGLGEWGHVDRLPARPARAAADTSTVVLGSALDADAVRDYGARIVVVATGCALDGRRHERDHPGADPGRGRGAPARAAPRGHHGRRQPARRAGGSRSSTARATSPAPALAEVLRAEGYDVDVRDAVRRRRADLRPDARGAAAAAAPARARASTCAPALTPTEILAGGMRAEDGVGRPLEIEADAIVLVTQRLSDDALYLELTADPEALSRGRHRRRLPGRRLRRPAAHRRRDLRRPPAGA